MTVVSLLLAMLLTGAEPPLAEPADELRSEVERWVERLEAPTLSERRRAERELLDLGPKVLRWLPPPELLPGPTSRDAVKRLQFQLQRKLAQDSARPSQVTLAGKFTLPELVTEITRQTGNAIQWADDLPPDILIARDWEFDHVTFWDAIDTIAEVLSLRPATAPATDVLLLTVSHPEDAPIAITRMGVLRAATSAVNRQPVTGKATQTLTRIQGELMLEPRLRPLFVHFRAGDFSATNGDGEALACWNPQARYELPMAGAARQTKITWDFVTPTDAAPSQISLTGKLLVHLAAATEPIRFDQLTPRAEVLRRRGGVSVRLHHVEFSDGAEQTRSAAVRVTVNYDAGGPAFESHRTWVYHNAAWLEDNQRRYPLTDFDTLQQTDGSVQLKYRFDNLPSAAESLKFVYEAPTLLLDVPFEVNFPQLDVHASE